MLVLAGRELPSAEGPLNTPPSEPEADEPQPAKTAPGAAWTLRLAASDSCFSPNFRSVVVDRALAVLEMVSTLIRCCGRGRGPRLVSHGSPHDSW